MAPPAIMSNDLEGSYEFAGSGSSGFDFEASLTFDMLSKDFNEEHGMFKTTRRSSASSSRAQTKPTQPLAACDENSCQGSISLSAFASGSLRLEDLGDEAFRNLDTPRKKTKAAKHIDAEEEETEATSVMSSFYDTMTAANESQSLMAALDLSVTDFDLREARAEQEREERRKEEEARAAVDLRVTFSRTVEAMPSALRISQRRLVPPSRHLERTKSVPRSMRVRWADEQKEIREKRLSI